VNRDPSSRALKATDTIRPDPITNPARDNTRETKVFEHSHSEKNEFQEREPRTRDAALRLYSDVPIGTLFLKFPPRLKLPPEFPCA
jgi:hypothetical protein